MQLHHNKSNESYGEESQDRPCRFYWAKLTKGKLETNHGPVLCRDFLGDTLVWKAKEKDAGCVYGWKYVGVVEKKYTSLVLDNYGELEHNVKSILNPIEEMLGLKLTTAELVKDQWGKPHIWTKGDKFWMLTTVHFSWYTTLLRYLTWDKKFEKFSELEKYHTNEWMSEVWEIFTKLPHVLPKLKITQVSGTANVKSMNNSTMHDYNGWRSNVDFDYKAQYTEYGEQLRALLT